jgi:hypothetical protein
MGWWLGQRAAEPAGNPPYPRWRNPANLAAAISALLLLGLACTAFWLALQLGSPARASLYSPQGLPLDAIYLCSNDAWSSLEAAPRRALLQLVGIGLLLPMPFLLVGAIAFLLYRSSRRNRRSQWEV